MKNIALIIAGGVGARTNQDIPKQFINVNDKPVIIYTLEAFQNNPNIDEIEISCLEGWHEIVRVYCKQFGITKLVNIVDGGINGQDSIRNGVYDIAEREKDMDSLIVIHDAIRPMVTADVITENIRVAQNYGNAVTVIPCTTAMLKSTDSFSTTEQVPRDNLKITQTPQTFRLGELVEAHKEALARGITASVASCTMWIELGKKLYMSQGSQRNIKITTADDLEIFKAMLNVQRPEWLH